MESEENGWQDDPLKELDLELENQTLELDLQMQGGLIYKDEETPPELYNMFLQNIKESESLMAEASETNLPVRSIFPAGFLFPAADQMTDGAIAEKLGEIKEIFSANNIELGLNKDLPERLMYTYITEEVLLEIPFMPYGPDSPFTYVIDGCGGYCPDCFQRDFCERSADWDKAL